MVMLMVQWDMSRDIGHDGHNGISWSVQWDI